MAFGRWGRKGRKRRKRKVAGEVMAASRGVFSPP
jgi:hypothetical protein